MPTTPPTATQVCVDPGFATGGACAEVCRPVHTAAQAPAQKPKHHTVQPAPLALPHAEWWGDAWALWTRHPQGTPPAADARADNLGLNGHTEAPSAPATC